ncbi:hypothetical protein HY605_02940 [Candidatus Peregrinibacteria bacterium]|nr:hypothetical protein [Candidatus Peregrinibacteria bacterium]
MAERGPETQDSKKRQYALEDVNPAALHEWAGQQFSPRFRILLSIAQPIVSPGSLRAAFSGEEMTSLINGPDEYAAWYELGDVGMLPAMPGSLDKRTLDAVMVVSHMFDQDRDVVEASPANVAQLHQECFSQDPGTQGLLTHITSKFSVPREGKCLTAHVMEYPGTVDDETLANFNEHASGGNMLGMDLPSRFDRPDLGHALQSAVARTHAPYQCAPSVIVTSSMGPSGRAIVVHSLPGRGIVLTEGLPEQPIYLGERPPVELVMVRPRFPQMHG